ARAQGPPGSPGTAKRSAPARGSRASRAQDSEPRFGRERLEGEGRDRRTATPRASPTLYPRRCRSRATPGGPPDPARPKSTPCGSRGGTAPPYVEAVAVGKDQDPR